jgi:multiple sugar transport system substrate-binding protein
MVATAQRYGELHPEVEILWDKRSLRQFEATPVEKLCETYDLVVTDHPFVGDAAAQGLFLPIDEWLPEGLLEDHWRNSVGRSHASYQMEGHLWAVAIDAAAPVAAWRPDLMSRHGLEVPGTWRDVVDLARAGRVEVPGAPINCLMIFMGLCASLGEAPFAEPGRFVSAGVGAGALGMLRELHAACGFADSLRNPIQSLELMASRANTDRAYCLFPYGYSNYSRQGYADNLLLFGDLPSLTAGGKPMTTTLGGTGLALSARSAQAAEAAAYAAFVASPATQATLYVQSGGQPAHRAAWLSPENNALACNYFNATLPALDRAYLRPRHAGYTHGFQDPAGELVRSLIAGSGSAAGLLSALDSLHAASLTPA